MRRNRAPSARLAMLHGEAVIRRGMEPQGILDAIEREFRRLVAVGMGVDLDAVFQGRAIKLAYMFRRQVPEPVRRAIVVARPAQPRREAMNRTVHDHFDGPQTQPVGAHRASVRLRARSGPGRRFSAISSSRRCAPGKSGSPVTRSIMSTASCGRRPARTVAVVTPLRTHCRANCRKPCSVAGQARPVEADMGIGRPHGVRGP